jgi:hypothetical protein
VGKGQTEMMIPPPFDEALMMIDDHRENLNLCSGILFYFIFGFLLRLLKYLFDFVIRKLKTTQLRKEKSAHFSPGGETRKSNNHHHFIELRKIGEKMANY